MIDPNSSEQVVNLLRRAAAKQDREFHEPARPRVTDYAESQD